MKRSLTDILDNLIHILDVCSHTKKAKWVHQIRTLLDDHKVDSNEFQNTLETLLENLTGMGSISDSPMYPKDGSRLTPSEASLLLWDTIEEIGELAKQLKI